MANSHSSYTRSPSTKWHFADGSLATGAAPSMQPVAEQRSIWSLRARDPRKPLDLQIRYVGGSEGLWEICARGWRWTFPATLTIIDVMTWVNRMDT